MMKTKRFTNTMSMKLSTNLNLWSVDERNPVVTILPANLKSKVASSLAQWLTLATMFEDDSFEVFDGD